MKAQQQTTPPSTEYDPLFEQMANISKAHGYDILAGQVKELKQVLELAKYF